MVFMKRLRAVSDMYFFIITPYIYEGKSVSDVTNLFFTVTLKHYRSVNTTSRTDNSQKAERQISVSLL